MKTMHKENLRQKQIDKEFIPNEIRISISQEQLNWILSCPDCPADLKKQLKLHLLKIDEGLIKPAYEIRPRQIKDISMEQKYKLACKYLAQSSKFQKNCKAGYDGYRYMNGLMSDEESDVYEQESLRGL